MSLNHGERVKHLRAILHRCSEQDIRRRDSNQRDEGYSD